KIMLKEDKAILISGLSASELDFFNNNGFVGPFKLYNPDEAREILDEIRIKNLNRTNILFDNDVNYDRHFDIPELTDHISHPGIINRIRSIIDSNILCWRTEFFPKFPGSTGTEWHQVVNYQYATGEPMLKPTEDNPNVPIDLTVWTVFTEATRENGCMKFLPGTHKKLYYDESRKANAGRDGTYKSVEEKTLFFGYNFDDFRIDPEWQPNEEEAISLEMKPGECVIFTARCIHGSHPNITKRSTRFAISSRYVPTHVRVYPEMKMFSAHGGHFDLERYGVVLVSGEDTYKHNKIRDENNLGQIFKTLK
ncbi:MAG: chlorinating enzyme, partial [Candidatus Thorarchaeota archaeon]